MRLLKIFLCEKFDASIVLRMIKLHNVNEVD